MPLQIIKPGLLSTVQDSGRLHFRGQAVPTSGPMDTLSARLANIALGNKPQAPVIEFTYADAELLTTTDMLLAWAGSGALLMAGAEPLPTGRPVFVPAGTTIRLANNPAGCRTYLAVAGGWDVPQTLGSRSTYLTGGFGGLEGRPLQAGDTLNTMTELTELTQKIFNSLKSGTLNYPRWRVGHANLLTAGHRTIRIIPGPEFGWFTASGIIALLSHPFTVTPQSNRMGYRLDGPQMIRRTEGELLSTAVTPGTLQVTNNNDLILLMADCQTTGGYPRMAMVAAVDMPLCGQLKPGDKINFEEIGLLDAEKLLLKQADDLNKLADAVRYAFG